AANVAAAERKLAACRTQPMGPAQPVKIPLVDGVIASSSQPGIMPAVTIWGDAYVDGGVREILPLQAAITLGATTVWAVQASPQAVEQSGHYSGATGLAVAARAVGEVVWHQVAAGNEIVAMGRDVRVIRPVVAVHESLQVDPGLIKISLDYGFMCAGDVFHSVDSATAQLADRITSLRKDTWR